MLKNELVDRYFHALSVSCHNRTKQRVSPTIGRKVMGKPMVYYGILYYIG